MNVKVAFLVMVIFMTYLSQEVKGGKACKKCNKEKKGASQFERSYCHVISLPAQPINTRKSQSRKKPTNLCAPRAFLNQTFLQCLIISESWLF